MLKVLIQNALLILFADDTSIIVPDSSIVDLQCDMKDVFEELNNWFNVNLLLLNFEKKTGFIHFKTQYARQINGKLQYENKLIANLSDTKFLG